ncbi:MAG: hypothetical protein CL558_02290 [Alphaproteobacteria bacterium]|nr:hypothetical protein [Alphaproteobacteria bacterium]MAS47303.1 hypothetical protein [Alphaproteobacteria bacterium]MAX95396.1 hypothetical protein [Alphaproteobacteria bacterium]MBN52389.1 hypothetical protein [Alphaproteobacteria bacterium]OUT41185.1 MAG: hypothetical protein CBB62_02155 [Micavibrio sp. TMED2]
MTMTDEQTPVPTKAKAGRRSIWVLAIALFLSLGLNLALGGFIAGKGGFRHGPGGHVARGFHEVARTMNDADRKVLREAFKEGMSAMRGAREERRELGGAVRRALKAEPFDRAALEAAMADFDQHRDRVGSAMQSAFVEAAGRLSPDGRRKLATVRMPGP